SSSCRKNKPANAVDQLPPETQTGANTFGCLIDGKVFVPRDGNGKPGLFVQYVDLGTGPGGGWHLNIPAYNYSTKRGISVETDSLFVIEGITYEFKNRKGSPSAFYILTVSNGLSIYTKSDNETGTLR
ncbi:hypothetical protein QUS89_23100, partial [Xanthomonas citri pv. citri]